MARGGTRGAVRAVLVLLALACAYAAQGLFDAASSGGWFHAWFTTAEQWPHDVRFARGAGLYGLSVALWVAALLVSRRLDPMPVEIPFATPVPPRPRNRLAVILFGGGVLLGLAGMLAYARGGETPFSRIVWPVSVALLIAACALPGSRGGGGRESPPFTAATVAVFAAILLAALWLRTVSLDAIPDDLHGDMAYWGEVARGYLHGHETDVMGIREESAFPKLAFLPTVASMAVFGDDLYGLRMTAALGGLVVIAAAYLLFWRLFDRHLFAALTAAILAGNAAHIHFSRNPANMDPWLFGTPALFFLVDGLKGRRTLSLVLSGILAGLAVQMYYSGRIVPILMAAMVLHALVSRPSGRPLPIAHLLLVAAAFVFTVGPNLVYFARNREPLQARAKDVIIFNPGVFEHSKHKYGVDGMSGVLWEQGKRALFLFQHYADSSTQYGYVQPMLNSVLAPLLTLGIGAAIVGVLELGPGFLLAWLVLMLGLGTFLTVDAPFYPRLVGLIPAAAGLVALTVDRLRRMLPAGGGRALEIAALAVVAATGVREWSLYAREVKDNGHLQTRVARYLRTLPPATAVCNLAPMDLENYDVRFLVRPRKVVHADPAAGAGALDVCKGTPLVVVIDPKDEATRRLLEARWPGGEWLVHPHRTGEPLFSTYFLGKPR